MTYSLYPYDSVELVVVFAYGSDYTRQMNILLIPEAVQIVAASIILVMSSAALVLSVIRRKLRLRRGGFLSAFIDTLIAFISGGNLRMKNKLERCFFAILLVGAFFFTSLFAGDLLDCIVRILNQKITKLEQLKEIGAPIYIAPGLHPHMQHINQLLR